MSLELIEELIGQMVELKADGLSNQDMCRAVGANEAMLYRWLNKPSGRLHSALSDAQKGGERIQVHPAHAIRKVVLHKTASGWRRRGSWSASTPMSTRRPCASAVREPRRRLRLCLAWPERRTVAMPRKTRRATRPMASADDLCIRHFYDVLGDMMAHGQYALPAAWRARIDQVELHLGGNRVAPAGAPGGECGGAAVQQHAVRLPVQPDDVGDRGHLPRASRGGVGARRRLPDESGIRVGFDDSIITDTTAEKSQGMGEVSARFTELWECRAKWYGEDEASARKAVRRWVASRPFF